MNISKKIKIGDVIPILKTARAREALSAMKIKPEIAGRNATISQVSPHGVSFEIAGLRNPETLETPRVELHLGIKFVKPVFGITV